MGDFAWRLFALIKAKKGKIVISDFLIKELEINYSIEKINRMIKSFEDIIIKITSALEQKEEAEKVAQERNIPKGDALHAILARYHNLILIARDNHFKELADISEHSKPKDLI